MDIVNYYVKNVITNNLLPRIIYHETKNCAARFRIYIRRKTLKFIISIYILRSHYKGLIIFRLLGRWPNTYTFTKAVAEDIVRKEAHGMPVGIFRPAIG